MKRYVKWTIGLQIFLIMPLSWAEGDLLEKRSFLDPEEVICFPRSEIESVETRTGEHLNFEDLQSEVGASGIGGGGRLAQESEEQD